MAKMTSNAMLFGIESSKGEYNGTSYDSTKFHISVDLGAKSTGKTFGFVSRPFKFGTSAEIERWAKYEPILARGQAVPVVCDFDVVASSDGVKLTLLGIEAASAPKA